MKQSNSLQNQKENESDSFFDPIRKENYDNTFPQTENWLRNLNNELTFKKTERKKFYMKNYFAQNKFRLAYTFLILAFVIAACNYPVTQQETVGDVISWNVSSANTDAVKKIENLDWFKKGEFNIKEENINGSVSREYTFIVPQDLHGRINEMKSQLESIQGISLVKIIPLNQTVKRPVYAALLNELFKIDIDATGKSDSEVSDEIKAQLLSAGIENASISFEVNGEGHRKINLTIPEESLLKDGGVDVTIKDGEMVNKLKEIKRTAGADRFKGKSDAEIRDLVREDLGNPDIKDNQIEIIREGENVKVKVKVDNQIGDKKEKIETEDVIK